MKPIKIYPFKQYRKKRYRMNLEGFKNSPAGRLLKVGQGEAAYWAFVPHPLPAALTFDAKL